MSLLVEFWKWKATLMIRRSKENQFVIVCQSGCLGPFDSFDACLEYAKNNNIEKYNISKFVDVRESNTENPNS